MARTSLERRDDTGDARHIGPTRERPDRATGRVAKTRAVAHWLPLTTTEVNSGVGPDVTMPSTRPLCTLMTGLPLLPGEASRLV